jgi:hypothetical protein
MHHAIKVTLLSLTVSFLGATSAKANQFFDLSYQGTSVDRTVAVVGVLEAYQPSADVPDKWLAVGITGTRNGTFNGTPFNETISALLAPSGDNDNLFYIGRFSQLSYLGITYRTDDIKHNFFYEDFKYTEYSRALAGGPSLIYDLQTLTITPRETPVPVPATLALFGLGLLGLGLTRAKRAL